MIPVDKELDLGRALGTQDMQRCFFFVMYLTCGANCQSQFEYLSNPFKPSGNYMYQLL
jgi:hypothetical protein